MIEGGWVCRACWQPNGPNEDRCYRCKTPRGGQLTVEPGSLRERAEPGWELKGRLDAELSILAYITAWPLRAYGAIEVVLGVIVFVIAALSPGEEQPPILGLDAQVAVALIGAALVVVGAIQIFLANSVRRHQRWAYVVALLIGLGGSVPRLLSLSAPNALGGSAWTAWYVGAWLYFAMAICAAALLVTSFVRRPPA